MKSINQIINTEMILSLSIFFEVVEMRGATEHENTCASGLLFLFISVRTRIIAFAFAQIELRRKQQTTSLHFTLLYSVISWLTG